MTVNESSILNFYFFFKIFLKKMKKIRLERGVVAFMED